MEQVRREAEAALAAPRRRPVALDAVVRRVCAAVSVAPEAVAGGGRRPALSRAREGIAYLWIEGLGRPGRPVAAALGVRPQSLYAAAARGRAKRARWDRLLGKLT